MAFQIEEKPDLVAGIEARGFVFAAALAQRLGTGLLLIRKRGKLPGETIAEEYALEYAPTALRSMSMPARPGLESCSWTISSQPAVVP
jgi:adenine phosphoribosyltransferase